MGNRRTREFVLKREDDAAWRRVRDEPRLAIHDIHARGIGIRRLQLIVVPSFEDALAFEVRQAGGDWRLFSSRVVESRPTLKLVGYDLIELEAELLSSFFERITALSLPLSLYLNGGLGLDGVMHILALFGDLYSEWRYQWWSNSPPQWQPLVDITNEMLQVFANKNQAN